MFVLFSPQTPLRTLRLGESSFGFFLAKAPRSPGTSMLDLLLPKTPLRALRLCEIIFFVSRRGAEAAENFDVYFVLTPTPLRTLRPGES
jgi:hypothetical protein